MTLTMFFELFVSLSVQVTIVVGATAWIATRRKLEGEAHRVWAACHFLILALVALAMLFPHLRLFSSNSIAFYTEQAKTASPGSEFRSLLFFFWAVGAAVGFFALLLGMIHAVRILRSSKPFIFSDSALAQSRSAMTWQVEKQNGEAIRLVTSPRTTKAFCWQFHRPYIVLPDIMQTFPVEELRGVICHEKAHLEAGHPLHLFLQRIVEILFWFHPLVWWASRQAAWSREFHCDTSAVTTAQEAASYLRGLLRITEQRVGAGLGLPAGLNFASGESMVQRRAKRIASRDWRILPVRRSFAVVMAPLLAAFAVSLGVWLPINMGASHRSVWSPWPQWSATALHELGVTVRDFEIDSHRLRHHKHYGY